MVSKGINILENELLVTIRGMADIVFVYNISQKDIVSIMLLILIFFHISMG